MIDINVDGHTMNVCIFNEGHVNAHSLNFKHIHKFTSRGNNSGRDDQTQSGDVSHLDSTPSKCSSNDDAFFFFN